VRQHAEEAVADILFQKTPPLFNNDHLFAELRKIAHQFRVSGVAHPHVEDRELSQQPQVRQHVQQVRPTHSGRDEPDRSDPFFVGRDDAIETQLPCTLARGREPLGELQFLLPGARRQ
jgi:hypothetical protein